MQKIFWIGAAVAVALAVGGLMYWLSGAGAPVSVLPAPQGGFGDGRPTPITPGSSSISTRPAGETLSIKGQGDANLVVSDFTKNAGIVADPARPGVYALAGGLTPSPATTPYSIVYFSGSQSFVVTLLQEPLGANRTLAENELQQYLGVSRSDMCALAYLVGVPDSVSEAYSGVNLGFSFCPGATQLP